MNRTKLLLVSGLAILSILLASCGTPAPAQPQVITQIVQGAPIVITATPAPEQPTEPPPPAEPAKKILRLSGDVNEPPSIDQVYSYGIAEIQIVEETSVGLMRQNEGTGELENGFASDYTVSADGLTYTFTLMENVPWVKYDPAQGMVVEVMGCDNTPRMVTADDFKYGILRTLSPATVSEYAYVLLPYLKGAADYNSGANTDPESVAVKVIDSKTLEVTFLAPAVYNLNLMGLWVAHAQPQWLIEGDDCTEGRADRWTETGLFQGYGPFTLKEWVHDYEMTLIKNPFWPGIDSVPQPKIEEVSIRYLDSTPSLAEYEAGNLDSSGFPSGDYDRIMNDPAFADQLRKSITIGTEFYSFNTLLPPTDDVRLRLALSLAIDRDSLVKNVTKAGVVAQFYTNPGAAGAPKAEKFPDKGIKFNAEKAKALLAEYLAEKNTTADQVKVTLCVNTSESNKRNAEAISGMWKDTLGITTDIVIVERAVWSATRRAGNENIYRSSWVQDYPDANNFLLEVFGPGGGYADIIDWGDGTQTLENPKQITPVPQTEIDRYTAFLALLKQAANELDPDKRAAIYADAEQILLVDEAAITPLYFYSGDYLLNPRVKDTLSITGYDRWEKWDLVE